MRNKYLLLGAASALMLAACSEDIKGPEANNKPVENALNLTSLSPASQAGRVSLPGQTRGPKADRLQLVAKVGPVSTVADQKWSATGIAISGTTAYVSWHSDHQAKVPAESWGGAIDALNITELAKLSGAINPANVITSTMTSNRVKFNNVVADGSNLYFPMTCYINGAVVGRLAPGAQAMDTIGIPGSSANAVYIDGDNLYAATGYAGGVYSMPKTFTDETKFAVVAGGIENVSPMSNNFGGKYIANGTVLRTDDEKAYLLPLQGGAERALDVPLTSTQKYAEAYDPVEGDWYELTGDKAAYYGKHTMAIEGNYTYIGAGKNGLRVYAATGLVWNNNTNTTAVSVAEVDGAKYVFAATGAGLRVYNLYDSESHNLPLYAYEVKNYNADGTAADAPNSNQPEAGTDAHSSNFVAVDSQTGLIFVANGQSGVYVFKLDNTVAPEKLLTGFVTSDGGSTQEVEEGGNSVTIAVPAGPEAEGKTFSKWVDKEGNEYIPGVTPDKEFNPGETIELTPVYNVVVTFKDGDNQTPVTVEEGAKVPATKFPTADPQADKDFQGWVIEGTETPFTSSTVVENNITVVPVWTDHVYAYTVKFDYFDGKDREGTSGLPAEMKSDTNEFVIPDVTPVWGERNFVGWSTEPAFLDYEDPSVIKKGQPFKIPGDAAEITLYGVWSSTIQGGIGTEEPEPVKPPVVGGEDTNGKQ